MSDAIYGSLLNNWFTISRMMRLADGQGGHSISYIPIAVVRGRIRPAASSEIERAQQDQRQITHVLYVLPHTDIARQDMVTCDGLLVDVLGVRDPSFAGHHLEVDCMEHQQEVTAEAGT
jgi:SPP1 family predicted phage head-tail adaptor